VIVVYKIATSSMQLANCILLHAYLFTCSCGSQLREHKQNLYAVYLLSWHNAIFDYKLKGY